MSSPFLVRIRRGFKAGSEFSCVKKSMIGDLTTHNSKAKGLRVCIVGAMQRKGI